MSSHVLSVTGFLPASPLAKGERIEVRGSLILIIKLANPHPTLSALHPGRDPREADLLSQPHT
jgi:hypothetical protein